MGKTVIEFKNFGFKYKTQNEPTLYDINLSIAEGEKVLILGGSGCGKSTLANCINGLIPFNLPGDITGSLKVNGKETQDLSVFELSKSVGTVLQDSDAQFVGLSVGEDLAFAMENECMPREEMVPRVKKFASIVGMQEFLAHVPFNLSGGQKQKVGISGVLGEDVNIMLFDEPLAALDPQAGLNTIDLIDSLADEKRAVVIIEHRLEDVLYRRVDRIIFMSEGRIVSDTTPEELLRSGKVFEYGVREPLYLTAMKYAGCDLDEQPQICSFEEVELTPGNKQRLIDFFSNNVDMKEVKDLEPILQFEHVDFAYDVRNVIDDVSFTIGKGERVAIIGKNGAGKTTAARLACGISRPKAGKITIAGIDTKTLSIKEIGEKLGYVMQNPNQMLIKDIIKDEIELALVLHGYKDEEKKQRAIAALNACYLYPMRNWPVDSISYGQKKRVTVASMMALKPDILVLDEPTAGQDYRCYTEIMEFVNRLNKEQNTTIIFITHDMHLALENTDRCVVFADGKIVANDNPYKVLADDEIIEKASLKQTSLYLLARKIGMEPETVIRNFIAYERKVKEDHE